MHAFLIVASLALVAWIFVRGVTALSGRAPRARLGARIALFTLGWCVLAIALVGLDDQADRLFSAHMVQHELLMALAAPLLVMSRPLPILLWAVPRRWRQSLGRISRRPAIARPWHLISAPAMAGAIQGVALWTWHIPAFFQAGLASEPVHALQHLSFLASALLFWWSVAHVRQRFQAAALLTLFITGIQTTILGALLTFAPLPWYPTYIGRSSFAMALRDQQLAGLIMWIPAGVAYLIAALAVVHQILRDSKRPDSVRAAILITPAPARAR